MPWIIHESDFEHEKTYRKPTLTLITIPFFKKQITFLLKTEIYFLFLKVLSHDEMDLAEIGGLIEIQKELCTEILTKFLQCDIP
jgi:hypothetical protein